MKPDIESFYHLTSGLAAEQSCSGLACYVARHDDAGPWGESPEQSARVYCLGKCYRAPARASDADRPTARIHAREAVVARNLGDNATPALETYRSRGGYRALDLALRRTPEEVVGVVDASELRGRGGAAFPTGRKWRAILQQTAREKIVRHVHAMPTRNAPHRAHLPQDPHRDASRHGR
jgi:hypothetical protein